MEHDPHAAQRSTPKPSTIKTDILHASNFKPNASGFSEPFLNACLFAKGFSRCSAPPAHAIDVFLAELQHFGTSLTCIQSSTRQNVQFAQNSDSAVKIFTCFLLRSTQPSPDALQNPCKEPKAQFSETAGGVSEAVQRTSRWQSSLCHALTSSRARQGTKYGTLVLLWVISPYFYLWWCSHVALLPLNSKCSTLPFTGINLPLSPWKWALIHTNKSHSKGTSVLCKAYLSDIKLLCHLSSTENCLRPA